MPALDQTDEFRPDLARDLLANAAMLVDVAPFAAQVEMVGVGGVAAQDAILDLGRRAVERVVVAVVDLVAELDEIVAAAPLHAKIMDVKIIALGRQRYQSHRRLLMLRCGS